MRGSERPQMVARRSPGVRGARIEQNTDPPKWVGVLNKSSAVNAGDAAIWPFLSGDDPHRRGLARTVGTEQTGDAPRGRRERDAVERARSTPKSLPQRVDLNHSHSISGYQNIEIFIVWVLLDCISVDSVTGMVPTRHHSKEDRMKMTGLLATVATAALALSASVLATTPAAAITACSSISYDAGSGLATANCSGNGGMRFVVSCHAIPPFQPWTQRSPWITVTNGGQTVVHRFPSCAAPSSVSVEYP